MKEMFKIFLNIWEIKFNAKREAMRIILIKKLKCNLCEKYVKKVKYNLCEKYMKEYHMQEKHRTIFFSFLQIDFIVYRFW